MESRDHCEVVGADVDAAGVRSHCPTDGRLNPLPLQEGGERSVELFLAYADGPGTLKLGEIMRETIAQHLRCGTDESASDSAPEIA